MKKFHLGFLFLLISPSILFSAQINKWTDQDGVTHYTSKPFHTVGKQEDTTSKIPSPTYDEIKSNSIKMTSAQFDDYLRKIKGAYISWSGVIIEVREPYFGNKDNLLIAVDMDAPGPSRSSLDVMFDLPRKQAINLKKSDQISFTGEISSISTALGLVIKLENIVAR